MTDKQLPDLQHWLIFTDLDGTLLDHHNYSAAAAGEAMQRLSTAGVPVIINSSKTLVEIAAISDQLGLATPQIAENGSVIFYPQSKEKQILGAVYDDICTILAHLRNKHDFKFRGFNDWTAAEIVANTGLDLAAAEKAAQREATEPLLWLDTDERLQQFRDLLAQNQLELKKGGRFWHVMGLTDKAMAMQRLQQYYEEKRDKSCFVIALGDSANDRDMLSAADIAIIVHNPHGSPFELAAVNHEREVIHTRLPGPQGWNAAILELLQRVEG